jgi:hypothetical protein
MQMMNGMEEAKDRMGSKQATKMEKVKQKEETKVNVKAAHDQTVKCEDDDEIDDEDIESDLRMGRGLN